MKVLVKERPDLAGLPFIMGDACRMSQETSRHFLEVVNAVRQVRTDLSGRIVSRAARRGSILESAHVAALMQVLEPKTPLGLAEFLGTLEHPQATCALAKLAIFSFEEEARMAAVAELKKQPDIDCGDLLVDALRYPWPAVAQNAAEALVQLKRRDLMPSLAELLDEPDPRAPVTKEVDGTEKYFVREVVRLNHHHNCITCHAPANSDSKFKRHGISKDFVTAPVSIPGQPLSQPSSSGYGLEQTPRSPDIFVRVDVTYLRQDFSLMQAVENADPWPKMQRFDFLVRTREVTAKEVAAYDDWRKEQGPDYVPPNHQGVHSALRRLSGLNAAPNAAAWRKALGLTALSAK